MPVIFLVSLTI